MEYFIVILVAFGASMLTFFSGFGLGTMLTPAFVLFLPPELAVAATAIVHFLNNLFKLTLIGKHINWRVVAKFGLPAIGGAFVGARMLAIMATSDRSIAFGPIETSTVNMVIGGLIFLFALFELAPRLKRIELPPSWLIPGGLLSGFFGGLSGHQGALRSAFLVKAGLSKEGFIASGVMIACLIDSIRITTYFGSFDVHQIQASWPLILTATASAFIGAFIGKRLLQKMTISLLQTMVGILMMLIALLLFSGLI